MIGFGFGGFDVFGTGMFVLVGLVFCFIFGMIIVSLVRSAKENRKNDASPRLDVSATVRSRRTQVDSHHHRGPNGFNNTHYDTAYFVTFEFPSGDRAEFSVSGQEYGMLCEGDRGTLHFQGTRYLGFTRG